MSIKPMRRALQPCAEERSAIRQHPADQRIAPVIELHQLRLLPVACIQPRYRLLYREPERELLPLATEEGLAVITYNPLAEGLLTGRHRAGTLPPDGGRFTLGNAAKVYTDRYWHDTPFASVDRLKALVEPSGLSLTTAAVAWVLSNPM